MPLPVIERHDLGPDLRQAAADQRRVAGETDLEGVFDHQRQQAGRGRRTHNRPLKPGRQQIGQAPDVVDVDVGDDQGADVGDRKLDAVALQVAPAPGLLALEQPAVHQQGVIGIELQAVATAGHAARAAVVDDVGRHGDGDGV
jgi:hypothetical protein